MDGTAPAGKGWNGTDHIPEVSMFPESTILFRVELSLYRTRRTDAPSVMQPAII